MFTWGVLSVWHYFFLWSFFYFSYTKNVNLKNILISIPINFFVNHTMTLFLTLIGLHTPFILRAIFLTISLISLVNIGRDKVSCLSFPQKFFFDRTKSSSVSLFLFLVATLLTFSSLIRSTRYWGTILDDWDSICSWNRWALSFSNNEFPKITLFYPQLASSQISISYLLTQQLGLDPVQFFSKISTSLIEFIFMLTALAWAISHKNQRLKNFGFLIVILLSYFPRKLLALKNSGADGLLFLISFSFLLQLLDLYLVKNEKFDKKIFEKWLFLIFTAIAGALTKQVGIFLILLCLQFLLTYSNLTPYTNTKNRKKLLLIFSLSLLIFWLPWNMYTLRQIFLGHDLNHITDLYQTVKLPLFDRFILGARNIQQNLSFLGLNGTKLIIIQIILISSLIFTIIKKNILITRKKISYDLLVTPLFFIPLTLLFLMIHLLVTPYDSRNVSVILPFLFIYPIAWVIMMIKPENSHHSFTLKQGQTESFSLKKSYPLRIILLTLFPLALATVKISSISYPDNKLKELNAGKVNNIGDKFANLIVKNYFNNQKESGAYLNQFKIYTSYAVLKHLPEFRDQVTVAHKFNKSLMVSHAKKFDYIFFYQGGAKAFADLKSLVKEGHYQIIEESAHQEILFLKSKKKSNYYNPL